MKENRDFKGVWIPKEIWLNNDLSIIEKVLLVEIDSLDNSERGCFASNEYLAKFVQLSESRVAHIISDLKKRKYLIVVFTDGRNRGLKLHPQQIRFAKNSNSESLKTTKQSSQKQQHNNTVNKTTNNTDYIIKNPSEFSHFEKVTIEENNLDTSSKVNPFTIVSIVEKEKEKSTRKKEKEKEPSRAERKPNETFEAFTLFCQTFEQLSGAAYPTDKNGHYIMNGKEAGNMVYLMRWIKQVDRGDDWREALRVFLNAAWDLNDKWLRANFNPGILYGQAAKIFTAYQTSSPAAKDKAYNDRFEELLAERMAKYND